MGDKYNIFIEGMQGAGKSTLLTKLAKEYPEYRPYREGDLSPVELAWCAYLTKEEYQEALDKYSHLAEEFRKNTMVEGERYIMAYTRILAENRAFYEWMEAHEIYNGRVSFSVFRETILRRYQNLSTDGNLFECSFFQNSIESMMLFYEMEDETIVSFYREAYEILREKNMKLLYLQTEDVRRVIEYARKERVDEEGNEVWFDLVLRYFETSPYAIRRGLAGVGDYVAHLERRADIEHNVIAQMRPEERMVLRAKQYELSDVAEYLRCGEAL